MVGFLVEYTVVHQAGGWRKQLWGCLSSLVLLWYFNENKYELGQSSLNKQQFLMHCLFICGWFCGKSTARISLKRKGSILRRPYNVLWLFYLWVHLPVVVVFCFYFSVSPLRIQISGGQHPIVGSSYPLVRLFLNKLCYKVCLISRSWPCWWVSLLLH